MLVKQIAEQILADEIRSAGLDFQETWCPERWDIRDRLLNAGVETDEELEEAEPLVREAYRVAVQIEVKRQKKSDKELLQRGKVNAKKQSLNPRGVHLETWTDNQGTRKAAVWTSSSGTDAMLVADALEAEE